MDLAEYEFETADVFLGFKKGDTDKPQYLKVRGLSTRDVQMVVQIHGSTVVDLFNRVQADPDMSDLKNAAAVFNTIIEQAPELVADLIVYASDSKTPTKAVEVALRLPLPVQLDALTQIARLTFEAYGGLGKFVETLIATFEGIQGLTKNLTSKTGSTDSLTQQVN